MPSYNYCRDPFEHSISASNVLKSIHTMSTVCVLWACKYCRIPGATIPSSHVTSSQIPDAVHVCVVYFIGGVAFSDSTGMNYSLAYNNSMMTFGDFEEGYNIHGYYTIFEYLGCYKDVDTGPLTGDLSKQQFPTRPFPTVSLDPYLFPFSCASRAQAAGSNFFGMENGTQCWWVTGVKYKFHCNSLIFFLVFK